MQWRYRKIGRRDGIDGEEGKETGLMATQKEIRREKQDCGIKEELGDGIDGEEEKREDESQN